MIEINNRKKGVERMMINKVLTKVGISLKSKIISPIILTVTVRNTYSIPTQYHSAQLYLSRLLLQYMRYIRSIGCNEYESNEVIRDDNTVLQESVVAGLGERRVICIIAGAYGSSICVSEWISRIKSL